VSRRRVARSGARASRGVAGSQVTPAQLMAEAEQARGNAYAPYSRFPVGAAVLTGSGHVIRGCNVENASYGLSVCAERNAIWKALSDGHTDIVAIAITARQGHGAPPCGSCRQVLQEFAPEAWVYWRNDRGRLLKRRLVELLPIPFHFPERLKR